LDFKTGQKMMFTKHILSVSALALAVAVSQALASNTAGVSAKDPVYDPATVVKVPGIVASVKRVPAGNLLAGVHLLVKSNTDTFDVYLGPSDFLKFLKVSFPAGDQIEVTGSKVKLGNTDVILTRKADDGYTLVTLRDANGVPVWQNWSKEVYTTVLQ
jgi:hypothetical protein